MATDAILKRGPTVDPNRLGEALGGIAVQGIQGIFSKPKPSGPSPAEIEAQRQAELERQKAEQQRQEERQRAEQERQRLRIEAEAARRRELERKKQEALGEMKDVGTGEGGAGLSEELGFKEFDESKGKEALGRAPARSKRICRKVHATGKYICSEISEKPAGSEQGSQPEGQLAGQESQETPASGQAKTAQPSGPAETGAVLKGPEQEAASGEEASGGSTKFFGTGGPEKPILESPEEALKTDLPGSLKGSLPAPPEAVRAPPAQPLKAAPASPSAQTGKIPQKLEPFENQKVSFPQAEGKEAIKEQADAEWEKKAGAPSFKGLSKEAQSKQTKVICQENIKVSDASCLNSPTPATGAAGDSLFKRSDWKTLESRLQKVGKNAKSHAQKAGVLLAGLRSPAGTGSSGAPSSQGASPGAAPKIEEPAPDSEQKALIPEEAQTTEQISDQVEEEGGAAAETKEKRYVCRNVGSSRICRWEEASQTQKRALPQSSPKRTQPAQRSKPSGVRRQ